MNKVKLWIYDPEKGLLEEYAVIDEKTPDTEKLVADFYRENGWNVINVSPSDSGDKLPERLSGLEEMFKPGVPDLFCYGKPSESNRFVEVKRGNDGLALNQIRFAKENSVKCLVIFVEDLKKEFECSDCGKIFDSERGLQVHKGMCYPENGDRPIKSERFTRFRENRSSSGSCKR